MPPAKTFEELLVWKKAHELVLEAYKITGGFPKSEMFGLTSQFRRAAVSIAANIAEGFKRRTSPDKVCFLNIAQGSAEECRYYLILARDLGYGDISQIEPLLQEVRKLLTASVKHLGGESK